MTSGFNAVGVTVLAAGLIWMVGARTAAADDDLFLSADVYATCDTERSCGEAVAKAINDSGASSTADRADVAKCAMAAWQVGRRSASANTIEIDAACGTAADAKAEANARHEKWLADQRAKWAAREAAMPSPAELAKIAAEHEALRAAGAARKAAREAEARLAMAKAEATAPYVVARFSLADWHRAGWNAASYEACGLEAAGDYAPIMAYAKAHAIDNRATRDSWLRGGIDARLDILASGLDRVCAIAKQ